MSTGFPRGCLYTRESYSLEIAPWIRPYEYGFSLCIIWGICACKCTCCFRIIDDKKRGGEKTNELKGIVS